MLLRYDSSGSRNIAVGSSSLERNLRGTDKVAVGYTAGRLDTAGLRSVYVAGMPAIITRKTILLPLVIMHFGITV